MWLMAWACRFKTPLELLTWLGDGTAGLALLYTPFAVHADMPFLEAENAMS